MALSILQWGCDISRCLSLWWWKYCIGELCGGWPSVTQLFPDDYTAQYESTQHLLAAGYVNRYASGYRKVRWQQGIVGRIWAGLAWCWTRSGWGETISLATGDDHYTDLASLLNDHFKLANQILMFWYVVTIAQPLSLSGSPGEGGTYPAGCRRNGLYNLVGVGHLFLPPLTTIQLPMTLSGGKLHCILLKVVKGEDDADPLPAVDPLFHLILC